MLTNSNNNNNNNTDQFTTIESDSNMKNAIATGTCAVFPCGFPPNSSNDWPLDVWRHVVVVFNRAGMIKTSSCSLYLDGHFIGSRRVSWILVFFVKSGYSVFNFFWSFVIWTNLHYFNLTVLVSGKINFKRDFHHRL